MPSFDVQHLTDFEKMRYYCANIQTFAAHYSTRGNWPKLFTALIRVTFRINTHFTHLFGKRCWNCTILPWQKTILERQYPGKPTLKVAFGNGSGAIFENSSKLRASLFVTSRWPRSSWQTNWQVHHHPRIRLTAAKIRHPLTSCYFSNDRRLKFNFFKMHMK